MNGDRLARKRKFLSFLLTWLSTTGLFGYALTKVNDAAGAVSILNVYALLVPVLLAVYAGANVAKAWVDVKNSKP